MNLGISYMGTKRDLSPYVCRIANSISKDGPFLDLFSGMCSVSNGVTNRAIWCNDTQLFANYVARLSYKTENFQISLTDIENIVSPYFERNFNKLVNRFHKWCNKETKLISNDSNIFLLQDFNQILPHVQLSSSLEHERQRLCKKPDTKPWRLFSILYAGGYFGINQCIEIDSIRYAIEASVLDKKITKSQYLWLLVALAVALSRASTTTGHFAQFLSLNKNNYKYFFRQRRRSVWLEWVSILNERCLVDNEKYDAKNRTYNLDANVLLCKIMKMKTKPTVIYADPPYTTDQYSRYYHIYDTLIRYDYPESINSGRYPTNRFRSNYSLKTQVISEIEKLIINTRKLSSNFILSYPENGIIEDTENTIYSLLKKHYKKVDIAHCIPHIHSTMGASKGDAKNQVNELIFLAK